ncbi:MAG: hypothetical protein ACYDH6_23445 [Acidimicrobiales bacterium]
MTAFVLILIFLAVVGIGIVLLWGLDVIEEATGQSSKLVSLLAEDRLHQARTELRLRQAEADIAANRASVERVIEAELRDRPSQ